MRLELKHIVPYLPYGLEALVLDSRFGIGHPFLDKITGVYEDLVTFNDSPDWYFDSDENDTVIKPILRPLSDLFKLIDWDNNNEPYMIGYKYGVEKVKEDGVEFYADEYYADYAESPKCYIDITSFNWWLFEYHFDVFGLIEQNLAIDINTI